MIVAVLWFGVGALIGALVGWGLAHLQVVTPPPEDTPAARRRIELARLVGILVLLLALFSFGQATVQRNATQRVAECNAADREALETLVRRLIGGPEEDSRQALREWLRQTERIAERCVTDK